MKNITYITSSEFKRAELGALLEDAEIEFGPKVSEVIDVNVKAVSIRETLEVDLEKLVRAEVLDAYQEIKVPCIVEHAGLIFDDYESSGYPGGLTKPMWNTLGEKFLEETHSANRLATAKAVVGYCNGKSIRLFTGHRHGKLSAEPKGGREFYWDTVFIPDTDHPKANGMTYAQIVEDSTLGLSFKMKHLSQSGIALRKFFSYFYEEDKDGLWSV